MKIITASRAHLPRMRAHKLRFRGHEHHFVFDNDKQRKLAMSELGLSAQRTHVAKTPHYMGQCGAAFVREWAERNLTDEGEWYATLDDNVGHFTCLPAPWYDLERIDFSGDSSNVWRELYDTPCTPTRVTKVWRETIAECERMDTVFGGFAIETNYYFRSLKWQRLGYVRCQCSVVKNTGMKWYFWPGNMLEDFTRSAEVVARHGSVVINRFMKPHKPFFEEGGIGTFEERRPHLVEVSDELLRTYPGLLRRNKGQDYQLTFALRSLRTVEAWRRKHGYVR